MDGDLMSSDDEQVIADVPTTSKGKPVNTGPFNPNAPNGIFKKDIRSVLTGFGDDFEPYDKTVDVLEGIVLEYIKELCQRSLAVGKKGRIQLEDIHYLIRRDEKKFARVKDLLSMSEELKKAKKQFEDVKVE